MATVFEQYIAQRRNLVQAGIQPVRVTFSSEGHMKALRENRDNLMFCPPMRPHGPATYSGLPFVVDKKQKEDILVGSTCHTPPIQRPSIVWMSDRIQSWLDRIPPDQMTKFDKGLKRLLETHGRFE